MKIKNFKLFNEALNILDEFNFEKDKIIPELSKRINDKYFEKVDDAYARLQARFNVKILPFLDEGALHESCLVACEISENDNTDLFLKVTSDCDFILRKELPNVDIKYECYIDKRGEGSSMDNINRNGVVDKYSSSRADRTLTLEELKDNVLNYNTEKLLIEIYIM